MYEGLGFLVFLLFLHLVLVGVCCWSFGIRAFHALDSSFFSSFSFFFLKCVGADQSRILAFPFFPLELRFVLGSVLVVVFN